MKRKHMPCTSEICQNKVDMIWNPLIEDLPFFTRFRLPQSLHVCGRSQPSARTCRETPKKWYGYRCRTKMKQLATSSSKILRNWTFSAPFWGSRLFSWSCALSFWGAPAWMGEFQHKNTPAPLIFLAGDGTFRNETSNQQWWSNTSPPHLCHKYNLFHWRVKVRFYQRVGFRECISN